MGTKLKVIEQDIFDGLLGVVPDEKLSMTMDMINSVLTERIPKEFTGAAESEPIFVLRGQDQTAAQTVSYWLTLNVGMSEAKAERAAITFEALARWPHKKRAD